MKKYRLNLIILLLFSLASGCSKEDDTPTDTRLIFVGNFESQEHFAAAGNADSALDATLTPAGILMEIELAQDSPGAIAINFEDLVAKVIKAFTNVPFSIDFDKPPLAQVSGNTFELEATEFTIKDGNETVTCTLTASGILNENTLILKYEFSFSENGYTFIFKSVNGEGNKMVLNRK